MSTQDRVHALDAVRALALLLGVVFHAGFSFIPGMIPGLWAFADRSPSHAISALLFVLHIFRMSLFFLVAGFFARLLFERHGARGFWTNRAKRLLVPLIAGWVLLFPTLAVIWGWGFARTFNGKLPPMPVDAALPAPPAGAFPLTHLWFLYYLLVIYAIVLTGRALVIALDRNGAVRRAVDAAVHGVVRRGLAAVALAVPVTIALYFHENWIAWFGVPTPDRSVIPEWTSLVAFGSAVTFGWLVHRQTALLNAWRTQWPFHAAAAVTTSAACLVMVGTAPVFVPMPPGLGKLAFALCYGLSIWCWTFAIVGIAMRYLSQANAVVRYVADASYWIYLAHLPLVAALQVLVGSWALHWSLKFPLIVVVSLALLFASYALLVRSTFIGQVLNGRRYPRRAHRASAASNETTTSTTNAAIADNVATTSSPIVASPGAASPTVVSPAVASPTVASLRGVHHRYGKTVALDGLDLDVHRGELLAVLGPNGAGKSTAIASWLGLLEPDEGSVQLFGQSPLDVDSRRKVGVMMQDVGLTPELRVRELIALTSSYYPHPMSTQETIDRTRIAALADRPYAKLSGGQKRQAQFALAICGRPSLLFLDEPTVGLDVPAREALWDALRSLRAAGCAVVLTTHYLEEAEALADRVAVLAGGKLIASGSVAEVRSLVSRKQITCSTRVTVDEVREWPGVVDATESAGRLRMTVVDAEAVVRRLLAADDQVRDLEVVQASLADAFTKLTMEAA